jgi:hypothetical protein
MTIREEINEVLQDLDDEQLQQVLQAIKPIVNDPFAGLRGVPGIHLPEHWPPEFEEFEPIKVEGEPVSEQLIRERR